MDKHPCALVSCQNSKGAAPQYCAASFSVHTLLEQHGRRKGDRIQSRNLHTCFPKGVPDFDDYTEEDLQQDPELGLTDEEVAAEVAKLSEEDKKLYEQIKTFTDSFYRQHGYIIPIIDLIQITMTKRYPGIPTQTVEQQEELRQELLQEIWKRKASEEANVEEAPLRKIRHIQTDLLPKKIIDITGEDDPDKPTVVTISLGEDPYKQLDTEEGELLYTVGDETKLDIHPNDAEGDDLSVITIDSLKELDSEKV